MSYVNFYSHRLPAILRQVKRIKRNAEPKYYAVAVGKRIGIYRSWPSCKVQIDGISNAKYRRFDEHEDALRYLTDEPKEIPLPMQKYTLPSSTGVKEATVYTDGSCWRNGMKDACAGVGIYWPDALDQNVSELIGGKQTSIRAELQAAILALQQAKKMGVQCLTIYTDSHFVIQCATVYLYLWKNNGYRTSGGGEVKNREDMVALEKAIKGLKKVVWRPVAGHSGVKGNEEADKLANQAIANYQKEKEQMEKEQMEKDQMEKELKEEENPTEASSPVAEQSQS